MGSNTDKDLQDHEIGMALEYLISIIECEEGVCSVTLSGAFAWEAFQYLTGSFRDE